MVIATLPGAAAWCQLAPPATDWLWRASTQAALLAGLVLLCQAAFSPWLSAAWRYRLWGLVVLRLLLPALPASPVSACNLLSRWGGDDGQATPPVADPSRVRFGVDSPGRASGGAGPRVSVSAEPPAWAAARPGAAAAPAPAAPPTTNWGAALGGVWLVGAAVLSLRLFLTTRRFARRLRTARPVADARLWELLARCAREACLRRVPPLLETDAVTGPSVVGALRPRLLLPPGLADRLSHEELRLVFLHECAHVRRADVAVNWLLAALEIAHWFNPVLWLAFSRCRADREMARDADALALAAGAGEAPARAYGGLLLKLIEAAGAPASAAPAAGVAMAPSPGGAGLLGRRRLLKRRMHMIARFRRSGGLTAAGLLLTVGLGCATLTGPKAPAGTSASRPAASGSSDAVETRVYDVRDLLVNVPDFDDAPDFRLGPHPAAEPRTLYGLGAGVSAAAPAPTRAKLVEDLERLMTDTVAPGTWHDAGGTPGTIRELSGQLIITQTPANHRRIAELLDQLHDARGVQVMVETRFLRVDEAALRDAGMDLRNLSEPDGSAGTATTAPSGPSRGGTFLDERRVNLLLRMAEAGQEACIVSAPRLTLFSGQRAYVLVATDRTYVSDFTPRSSTQPATRPAGFDPRTGVVTSGIALDVRATASADRQSVTLTLHPQLSAVSAIRDVPWPGRPAGSDLNIQVPEVTTSEMNTTVSVPNNTTLLLAGLKDPGDLFGAGVIHKPAETRPAAGPRDPNRHLIILVKPTVILPERQPHKEFPLLSTRLPDEPQTRPAGQ